MTPDEYMKEHSKSKLSPADRYIEEHAEKSIPPTDRYIMEKQGGRAKRLSGAGRSFGFAGRVGDYFKGNIEGTMPHMLKTEAKELPETMRSAQEFAQYGGQYNPNKMAGLAVWGLGAGTAAKAFKPKGLKAPTPKRAPVHPSVTKIIEAIKEAKPIRKKQDIIYTAERKKQLGRITVAGEKVEGEAGFIAQLGAAKGELKKVAFEPVRPRLTQTDIDDLFKLIHNHPEVRGFENLSAKNALADLLGSRGGVVPTPSGLALLDRIFPPAFTKTLMKKRDAWTKVKEAAGQAVNVPRSIMSSFDLSAPFRQGLVLGAHSPKRFFQSFAKMFKQFPSETAYKAVMETIRQKPTYQLMKESGVALMDLGKGMTTREEAFMSQWAERIPLIGRGVRASGRAYTGFLNKLRADVFEDLVFKAEKLGLDPTKNMKLTKEIARFVNAASGRGGLSGLEKSAVALNAIFFSPRLIGSRLTLLNPGYYIRADPFVRKEALKSLFTISSLVSSVLGLAHLGGAKVGTDRRSADFGKIRIGNTRIDIMGGFQQYLRMAGQLQTGEYVSTTTGKKLTLGEGYKPLTHWEILIKQAESKLSPVASFVVAMMKGQGPMGEKIKVSEEIASRFTPMVLGDMKELAEQDPDLLPLSVLGVFGVGIQTYPNRPPKSRLGIGGIEDIGSLY